MSQSRSSSPCTGYDSVVGMSRRVFLQRFGMGVGSIALADLLSASEGTVAESGGMPSSLPHFAPKAKRVIYLFQSGGPSQLDLYDHKPELKRRHGEND